MQTLNIGLETPSLLSQCLVSIAPPTLAVPNITLLSFSQILFTLLNTDNAGQ